MTFSEEIINQKNSIKESLLYCVVINKDVVEERIRSIFPNAKMRVNNESDEVSCYSLEYSDYTLKVKFVYEKRESSYYIKSITKG